LLTKFLIILLYKCEKIKRCYTTRCATCFFL